MNDKLRAADDVDILFLNEDLRELCSAERVARRRLGPKGAKKLKSRLADLLAVVRVTDLAAGHPHALRGDRAGQFALNLAGGCRLVFAPGHATAPIRPDSTVAWEEVTIVRVVYIGDYHD